MQGLEIHGQRWKEIQKMVPTRTLVQIRTHAQKYFMRHPTGPGSGMGVGLVGGGGSGASQGEGEGEGAGAGRVRTAPLSAGTPVPYPLTWIRHVCLEPLSPLEPLGLCFHQKVCEGELGSGGYGFLTVSGFQMLPVSTELRSGALQYGLQLSSAEESDLVRVGDVVLGVAGMSTAGMDVTALLRTIAAARSASSGSVVVLHLCDAPIIDSEVEEASVQMAVAAAHLLGGRGQVEACWLAIRVALGYQSLPTIFPAKSPVDPKDASLLASMQLELDPGEDV